MFDPRRWHNFYRIFFRNILDQTELLEKERREEAKIRSEVVEQMMADVMSRGALSATDQQVAPISKHQTAPMKNQCRRLHDTKINHAGSTTQEQMSQRTLFKGNKFIIFRSDHVSNRIRNPWTNRIVQCSLSELRCPRFIVELSKSKIHYEK